MAELSTTTRRTRSATRRNTPAPDHETVESPAPGPPPSPTPIDAPQRVRSGPATRLPPVAEKVPKRKKGKRAGTTVKPHPILEQLITDHPDLRGLLHGQDLSSVALERLSTSTVLLDIVQELVKDPSIPSLAICTLLESDTQVAAAVGARQGQYASDDALRNAIWSSDEQAQWSNPNFPLQKVPLPSMPPFPSPSPYEQLKTPTDGADTSETNDITQAGEYEVVVPFDGVGTGGNEGPPTSKAQETVRVAGDGSNEMGDGEGIDGGVGLKSSVASDAQMAPKVVGYRFLLSTPHHLQHSIHTLQIPESLQDTRDSLNKLLAVKSRLSEQVCLTVCVHDRRV
jgi:hypothetical protein